MRVKSTRKTMRRLFDRGTAARPEHLLTKKGMPTEWAVQLRTGPLLDISFLGHRVRLWRDENRVLGCHVVGKNRQWGRFTLVSANQVTAVCYDYQSNSRLVTRMAAELRATDYAHLFVGKLYVELLGKPRLAGYFTLRKKGDKRRAPPTTRTKT